MKLHYLWNLKAHGAALRRLLLGVGANFLGKVWVLLLQMLAVPVFIASWSVEGYGIWLMLTAIPTYLALSDFGLATAARADLTAMIAEEKRDQALTAFQSVWAFLSVISAGIAAVCALAVVAILFLNETTTNLVFTPNQIAVAAVFIIGAATLNIQMNILKVVFESSQRYALGTIAFDLAFLATSVSAITVAIMGGDIVFAALAQLVTRLISLFFYVVISRRFVPWCLPGFKHVKVSEIKRLLNPSVAAIALQGANSLGLQGVVLTLGFAFNPSVVALFATARMITRIPLQFSSLLTRASLPELTRAKTLGQADLAKKLSLLNVLTATLVMGTAWLILSFFGPQILFWISKGNLNADNWIFVLLGLAALFSAMWSALGASLMSVNRHGEYAYHLLILYTLCALVPFIAQGHLWPVLVALVVADALVVIRTYRLS